ncbi:MAG: SDR family NAD(P)-dependent oxidoreductase [Rhodospirillales bacterium]|nr:SDR family NAD(P)-dependent oxidoreductase [Rhodospirillales bacterium]
MTLGGRHALVTGGGQGIGAAVARALTTAGARVTVLGRHAETLEAVVAAGTAAAYVVADVTDATALPSAMAELAPVDILVNNAGAAESAPFVRTTSELWARMLAVNLTGVFVATQAVLPGMLARRWGRVVTIASTAGLTGYPYVSAYAAAKHGAIGLTRALAREIAASGVTVNAVCPGYTQTALIETSIARIAARGARSTESIRAEFTRASPQGRLVQPEEVAAAVLYFCGPGSDAVTGVSLPVAGGEVQ